MSMFYEHAIATNIRTNFNRKKGRKKGSYMVLIPRYKCMCNIIVIGWMIQFTVPNQINGCGLQRIETTINKL